MSGTTKIDFCPYCGNKSEKILIHVQSYDDVGYYTDGLEKGCECVYRNHDFLASCKLCSRVLIYNTHPPRSGEPEDFLLSKRVFPKDSLIDYLPPELSSMYEEALKVEQHSPSLFTVQIRKMIEAICYERGVSKGNLYERLKEMTKRNLLPGALSEATDLLRKVGNIGAHEVNGGIHPMEVDSIKSLFTAIAEHIYIVPSKIGDFKNNYQQYREWARNADEQKNQI